MHLLLAAADSEPDLHRELTQSFPGTAIRRVGPLLLETDFPIAPAEPLPHLAFLRQWLPNARAVWADSIRSWANQVFQALLCLPESGPWRLHVEPHYGREATHRIGARAWHSHTRERRSDDRPRAPIVREQSAYGRTSHHPPSTLEPPLVSTDAGRHRCELIRNAVLELLQRKRRGLLRTLQPAPQSFRTDDSLVQVLLTSPETGFLSMAQSPQPFKYRHLLSPFPKGEVRVPADKQAPSRAFVKLIEAELRLGAAIEAGHTCVDLGASPGSWTYVAAHRGARVIAVDRSPLRTDLMSSPLVEFHRADAFTFRPGRTADWLLCDVIAEAKHTAALLLDWLRAGCCHRFVVTLKIRDVPQAPPESPQARGALHWLKEELPHLTREFFLTRLCANKKEVCVFGTAVQG